MIPPAASGGRPRRRRGAPGRPIPRDLAAAIDGFLLHLRVERGLSPATIAGYGGDLADFGRSPEAAAGWGSSPDAALDYLGRLAGGAGPSGRVLRPTSLRRRTAALRTFYRFALAEELVAVDVASHLDLPREPRILPDPLTVDEVDRLLAAVDPDAAPPDPPAGRRRTRAGGIAAIGALRDRALLELLYAAGLRISEALRLDGDDLDLAGGSVRVIGKGDRERVVPVGDVAVAWLTRYLDVGRPVLAAADRTRPVRGGPVFLSDRGRRLGRNHGWTVVKRAAASGRPRRARLAAHAAPLLRHAPPGGRGRPARRTGTARACQYFDDADLHAPDGRANPRGLCAGTPAGLRERDGKDRMGYTESLLATNEVILYRTKQHWMAPIFGTIAGVLVLLGGVFLFGFQLTMGSGFLRDVAFWISLGLLVVGAAMVGYSYIQWWVEDYAVTNQKVMKVAGLLNKRTSGAALEKINDVIMEQGPLGRMLGYGTLKVSTASDTSDLTYETMRKPAEFRRAMLDQKMEFEQADARHIADAVRAAAPVPVAAVPAPAPAPEVTMPAPVAPAPPSADDKLRSLAKLRDDGIISPEEFEAKKAELLDQL